MGYALQPGGVIANHDYKRLLSKQVLPRTGQAWKKGVSTGVDLASSPSANIWLGFCFCLPSAVGELIFLVQKAKLVQRQALWGTHGVTSLVWLNLSVSKGLQIWKVSSHEQNQEYWELESAS